MIDMLSFRCSLEVSHQTAMREVLMPAMTRICMFAFCFVVVFSLYYPKHTTCHAIFAIPFPMLMCLVCLTDCIKEH